MSDRNLYPPIVNDYLPAIPSSQKELIIPFSISTLNKEEDYCAVQIMMINQQNNRTAIDDSQYARGVKIVSKEQTISIKAEDLLNKTFNENQIYKIQLRLINSSLINEVANLNPKNISQCAEFLDKYKDKFSEWSTVILVKCIREPQFLLKSPTIEKGMLNTNILRVIGELINTDEILNRYSVSLINNITNEVIDTQTLGANQFSDNQINFTFTTLLSENIQYSLIITYETKSLYTKTLAPIIFTYEPEKKSYKALNTDIYIEKDIEEQLIQIQVLLKDNEYFKEDKYKRELIIMRANNYDKFSIWKDIHIVELPPNNYIYYKFSDMTIESGTWYQYGIQIKVINIENENDIFFTPLFLSEKFLIIMDDATLVGNYTQLKVKFNPKINNLKYNVQDSITQTIGSQYPFFRRNANMKYRTFSLSGLISFHMDDTGSFASNEDLFEDSLSAYQSYNSDNNINPYNDFILERKFREAVMDFLYEDNIKLFRSTPEGNILVKLTDISLTPVDNLGRMIYSFSATATEIDEYSIENLDKYNIQNYKLSKDEYKVSTIYILNAIEYPYSESSFDIPFSNELAFIDESEKNITALNHNEMAESLILSEVQMIETNKGAER